MAIKSKKLLSVGSDAKTAKGEKKNYLTGILYLAPYTEAGLGNMCPHASKGCAEACLFTAGRAKAFSSINEARVRKTREFMKHRNEFMHVLVKDIKALQRKGEREDMDICVRLNGTSDIGWESVKFEYEGKRQTIMDIFPDVQFYDYTKNPLRMKRQASGKLPGNYDLTFSRSEDNEAKALEVLANGGRVAVVFDKLPKTFKGFEVVDADETDLRFLDPKGVICGLKAKGDAKQDESGFVVHTKA